MGRDASVAGSIRAARRRGGSSFAAERAMLGPFGAFPPGCSSDWQSAAFGTQKSLVQIQSPRFTLPSRRTARTRVRAVRTPTMAAAC